MRAASFEDHRNLHEFHSSRATPTQVDYVRYQSYIYPFAYYLGQGLIDAPLILSIWIVMGLFVIVLTCAPMFDTAYLDVNSLSNVSIPRIISPATALKVALDEQKALGGLLGVKHELENLRMYARFEELWKDGLETALENVSVSNVTFLSNSFTELLIHHRELCNDTARLSSAIDTSLDT